MHYTFTSTEVTLECEECGAWNLERTGDIDLTVKEIYARLRQEGWKIGKKDLCPKCSGK